MTMKDWKFRNRKRVRSTMEVNNEYHRLPATKPPAGLRLRHPRVGKLGIPESTVETPQINITIRSQQSRPSARKPSMPKMPWDTK